MRQSCLVSEAAKIPSYRVSKEDCSNHNAQSDRASPDQREMVVSGATSSNCVDDSDSDGVADN